MIEWDKLERRARVALAADENWHKEMPLVHPAQILGLMIVIKAADRLSNAMLQASTRGAEDPEVAEELTKEVRQAYVGYVQARRSLEVLDSRDEPAEGESEDSLEE